MLVHKERSNTIAPVTLLHQELSDLGVPCFSHTFTFVGWVVGSGDGAVWLTVPERPTTGRVYGRAGACCACSRCRMGGLCIFFFFFLASHLSYLPVLMPHLLGNCWAF